MGALSQLEESVRVRLDELSPQAERVAVCRSGPAVFAMPGTYKGQDFFIVSEGYLNGLRAHRKIVEGIEIRFLVTDRSLLESDIRSGSLGDFLTEKFLYPYDPILNSEYLSKLEVEAKTRVVKEETKDLVVEYGEMSRGVMAKPEFFGLSRLRKRARVFIPSMADYLRLLEPSVRSQNIARLGESFKGIISTMRDDVVELEGEYVRFQDPAIDRWVKDRISEQAVNIFRQSQRAFYSYLTKGRSIYLNLDLIVRELSEPLRAGFDPILVGSKPEDPKDSLFLRTSEGPVSLNESASLGEIVAKLRPGRPITLSPLAGVLNEVFLITAGKEQFVAKKFTDWHGFKWFTLNLVSFGSKVFAVSGKSRMENEYGMNRYLSRKGLKVPHIIHVNLKQRILVENFIPGIAMSALITEAVNANAISKSQYKLLEELGETLARIHESGVSVGDSKPENFVARNGEIFTVDLEQAGRRGDFAWDVAELVFYAGHYSTGPTPTRGLSRTIEAFTTGYLRKGGPDDLKQAAGMRYAKPFSFWTSAPIIFQISKILNEAGRTS